MDLAERVAAVVGQAVVSIDEIPGAGGYTPALRRIATLADGSTVFVKAAVNDLTEQWLRQERGAYRLLGRRPYVPRFVGAADGVLVLEDLRHARWPPPWRDGDLERVLAALDEIASTSAPDGAPDLEAVMGATLRRWTEVAANPEAFLGLGLCSPAWFDRAIPVLLAAEAAGSIAGDALVHFDVRSDNICLLDDRAVLIDWTGTCRGRGDFDLTCFAQTVAVEGGPDPDRIHPGADPSVVAMLASYMAHEAPQPVIPQAPRVREVQRAQLRVCLPWAARLLDLPPPS